ncbi:isocitrate lyase/phosphoenolpyruvate mutase family protein [Janthinobacterium sp. GW458P]|uniref:isocitrate lyase/PEP mutase family protein n=1 Tax=Janthinobacterium sp. GW458P TaxID=1981504 RepID=UPI000A322E9E|nr:isocitrate lyase/phosphoenolpyruvate mutase family protein [Janthinobacterium sp. GW458P]MBE3025139.1 isocitrate lyase/phosphoenolpyruvate mutase family protein [Janthinobacterium sp. GW458P]PHV16688.1 isocitrate lyase/phosphoenolpyruvate mutase family protein [Janthinobacterium sp. BJB303]
MNFAQLHQQAEPLLLANVWDAASARAATSAGYAVIGTSSAAIADTLGYADGEGVSFADLKTLVARLQAVTDLPLTVDVEAGYGETASEVVDNLLKLTDMGVVGVNLEDSVVRNGMRELLNVDVFVQRLADIRTGLKEAGVELFLNVRTDTFLLGIANALTETVSRGRCYAATGADGLFVPGVTDETDIATIVAGVSLPLNVMCMPNLPSVEKLTTLGVKRISMGNFLHSRIQQTLLQLFVAVREEKSFQRVFAYAGH